jgi:hypothetical protein
VDNLTETAAYKLEYVPSVILSSILSSTATENGLLGSFPPHQA